MTKRELRRLLRRGLVRIERTGGNWRFKSSAQRFNRIVHIGKPHGVKTSPVYLHGIPLDQIRKNIHDVMPIEMNLVGDDLWKVWKSLREISRNRHL
jgi:hypothetical protein